MNFRTYEANGNHKIRGINNVYSDAGSKKIAISNNVSKLNVISTLTIQHIDPSRLKRINLGKNVTVLDTNCFKGCTNLSDVQNSDQIIDIGDFAFCDCTSLQHISILDKNNNQKLDNIGTSAFANSGLEEIYISLRGSSSDTQIQQGAFANCKNLKDVTWKTSDYTSHYMFENCTSLTGVHFGNHHSFLGTHVFKGCTALKNVVIPTNCYGINDYTFEDCTNLTSVTIKEPSLMTYNESIGPCAFSGTGLTSFTFPASITSFSMISEYALQGASKLTSITFNGMDSTQLWEAQESVDLGSYTFNKWINNTKGVQAYNYKYYEYCANISKLTSYVTENNIPIIIEFGNGSCNPCQTVKSVFDSDEFIDWMKSLTKNFIFFGPTKGTSDAAIIKEWCQKQTNCGSRIINPACFLIWTKNGTAKYVHGANKVPDAIKDFVENTCSEYTTSLAATSFSAGTEIKTGDVGGYTSNTWLDQSGKVGLTLRERVSEEVLGKVTQVAKQSNIPIIMISTKGSGCGYCEALIEALNQTEVINWMKSLQKNFLFVVSYKDFLKNELIKMITEVQGSRRSWGGMLTYWKKSDGTVVGNYYDGGNNALKQKNILTTLRSFVEDTCKDYEGSGGGGGGSVIIANGIVNTNCFGLNHDCIIHSSDGKEIEYKDDGLGGKYINYEQTIQVDRVTVDDFRYGQWYYQAKALREYADENDIPVFLEQSSSRTCQPCWDFHSYIFNNSDFQNYMKSKKILLCNVDSPTNFKYDIEYYISHNWVDQSDPEYEKGKLPLLMMYWYNSKGNVTYIDGQNSYSPSVTRKYGYYLGHEDITLSDQWDVAKLTAWIDDFIVTYTPKTGYETPTITTYGKQYKKYDNQWNDDSYGRYFPVYKYVETNGKTYTIKIGDITYNISEYDIGSTEDMPPDGTYQYFTTTSTDNKYDLTCDMYGITFQVGPRPVLQNNLHEEWSSASGKTLASYKSEKGITDDKINRTSNYYYDDIYQKNEDGTYKTTTQTIGGETLTVPVLCSDNECKTQDNHYQYNYMVNYKTTSLTYSGNNVDYVYVYMWKTVYTEDGGQSLIYKTGESVVQANMKAFNGTDGINGLRWIREFSNLNEED